MTKLTNPAAEDTLSLNVPIERVFLADDIIPDAAGAFGHRVVSIDEAIKTADIVLDTNVLLLPYGAGSDSLANIIKKFSTLAKANRLFLPAQVAREFIRNRPAKLAELQQQLMDKVSKFQAAERLKFPVLEGLKEYDELTKALEKTAEVKKQLTEANTKLLKIVKSWEWNDPVANGYRSVFNKETIVQPEFDREKVLEELKRRLRLKIPPGYKDGAKEDLGIGDFLVWKTILDIGTKNKKPLILVSGDEKPDWQHRSSTGAFLPRFELLDEYRRASGGQAFYIIPFSKMLELLDAGAKLVEEIKEEEKRIHSATTAEVICPYCARLSRTRVRSSISEFVKKCEYCEKISRVTKGPDGNFIGHKRLSESVRVNYDQLMMLPSFAEGSTAVNVSCPICDERAEILLPNKPHGIAWCNCKRCDASFTVQRQTDGSFFSSLPSYPPMPGTEDKDPDA
jgi:rRNA-processing protein FCF1